MNYIRLEDNDKVSLLEHCLILFIANLNVKSVSHIYQPFPPWNSQPCVIWLVHLTTELKGKTDML